MTPDHDEIKAPIADIEPAAGEVLVKVRAATVNPVDIGNLAGKVQFASRSAAVDPPRTAGHASRITADQPGSGDLRGESSGGAG
jgi:NADPH:quinone reductase-like Zn-dependent oxidoreductase